MGALAHIADRLLSIHRSRGMLGLAAFLATRLGHKREDLLFEADPASMPGPDTGGAWRFVYVDRGNVGTPAVADIERQVFINDNGTYRPGLFGDDALAAILDGGGRVVCYGFVLFKTSYKRVLHVADDVPMIGNCFTETDQRGRGLYVQLLRLACAELGRRGHERVVISCAPDNVASRRGIERAGFRCMRCMKTIVVLSRVLLWQRVRDVV